MTGEVFSSLLRLVTALKIPVANQVNLQFRREKKKKNCFDMKKKFVLLCMIEIPLVLESPFKSNLLNAFPRKGITASILLINLK